jgi:hypothetical protein
MPSDKALNRTSPNFYAVAEAALRYRKRATKEQIRAVAEAGVDGYARDGENGAIVAMAYSIKALQVDRP